MASLSSIDAIKHSLAERLANSLPLDTSFTFYHISTPPTRASAIHSAPPGARPETTFLESHFLTVSIRPGDVHNNTQEEILVLAVEVLVYTTKHLTTIFVSKADSTGYLGLAGIARGVESPLRAIASTFLQFLVEKRTREDRRLVISLFARANDQYLFPGSVENAGKHVSDDRQLIKWWCRVLDPILRNYKSEIKTENEGDRNDMVTSQAFLIVPGEEGILGFLPPDVRLNSTLRARWSHGHPLRLIARYPAAPPRCLVPHFPDDPKSRFLDELDDELPETISNNDTTSSPSKRGNGQWKSVRSLDQFWEMMAFRQECSSGRLVGFVWVVFSPQAISTPSVTADVLQKSQSTEALNGSGELQKCKSPSPRRKPRRSHLHQKKKVLKGPIISRSPRIKTPPGTLLARGLPEKTKYFFWPKDSRGEVLLSEKDYRKATEVLLRLDFANREIAGKSTKTWIDEVGVLSGAGDTWGIAVKGHNVATIPSNANESSRGAEASVLGVKRKSDSMDRSEGKVNGNQDSGINNLSAGLIKKKPKKIQPDTSGSENIVPMPLKEDKDDENPVKVTINSGVKMLDAGLIRKRPKIT